jgi:hypothetical protein
MEQHLAMLGAQLVDQFDSGRRCDHAGDFFLIGHHMPSQKKERAAQRGPLEQERWA